MTQTQHIEIPIAFEWRPMYSSWHVVQAQITGMASGSTQRYPRFQCEVGERVYATRCPCLQAVPQRALDLVQERRTSDLVDCVDCSVELLVCSPGEQKQGVDEGPGRDPWNMRNEFLKLKHETKTLLAFLNRWGAWGPTRTSLPAMPEMPELTASDEVPRQLGMPRANLDPKKLQAALDGAMSAGLVGI